MLKTALRFSHQLLAEIIEEADTVVDATVGNGHDTLFLAQLVGERGTVYGFDVQAEAIATTTARLQTANLQNVRLFLQGHETVSTVLPAACPIKAAIFNLGYLPKSDKQIITQPETTLSAVQQLLERLVKGGRIVLVVYFGHTGGENEKKAVLTFAENLPQAEYTVLNYQFINQRNAPPLLLAIEKK